MEENIKLEVKFEGKLLTYSKKEFMAALDIAMKALTTYTNSKSKSNKLLFTIKELK